MSTFLMETMLEAETKALFLASLQLLMAVGNVRQLPLILAEDESLEKGLANCYGVYIMNKNMITKKLSGTW